MLPNSRILIEKPLAGKDKQENDLNIALIMDLMNSQFDQLIHYQKIPLPNTVYESSKKVKMMNNKR